MKRVGLCCLGVFVLLLVSFWIASVPALPVKAQEARPTPTNVVEASAATATPQPTATSEPPLPTDTPAAAPTAKPSSGDDTPSSPEGESFSQSAASTPSPLSSLLPSTGLLDSGQSALLAAVSLVGVFFGARYLRRGRSEERKKKKSTRR